MLPPLYICVSRTRGIGPPLSTACTKFCNQIIQSERQFLRGRKFFKCLAICFFFFFNRLLLTAFQQECKYRVTNFFSVSLGVLNHQPFSLPPRCELYLLFPALVNRAFPFEGCSGFMNIGCWLLFYNGFPWLRFVALLWIIHCLIRLVWSSVT